jgi:hypothetical protein
MPSYIKQCSNQSRLVEYNSGELLPRLSKGISKHQQLKKKYAATAVNTLLTQCTPKQPISEQPDKKQANAKTPAKSSAYQIPSITVVFVVLVYKV